MSFLTGCVVGVVGSFFGVIVVALCVAAKREKGNHPVKPDSWEARL